MAKDKVEVKEVKVEKKEEKNENMIRSNSGNIKIEEK